MLEYIKELIKDKSVLILGFGREGRSTYKWLLRAGGYKKLGIADCRNIEEHFETEVSLHCGTDYQDAMNEYDIVFKSPGIVLEHEEAYYSCMLVSEVEIFLRCYRDKIIGITGTKGKSTTTSLIYHILKSAGKDALIAGNIGIPVFEIADDVHDDTIVVLEFSSHQLEYVTVSPHVAVLLNIHEEHLDHYGTMEKYVAAKKRIYLNQEKDDIFFVNKTCLPEADERHGRLVTLCHDMQCVQPFEVNSDESEAADIFIGADFILYKGRRFDIPVDDIKLLGHHNHFNIGVAYGVCSLYGVTDEEFANGLISFDPLPHRLQNIGTIDGVTYYDDSISTICDTAIQALNSIKNVGTIIIGGMDRGIDYRELIEYLGKAPVDNIILMYATGKRIYEEIKSSYGDFEKPERLIPVDDLAEAVSTAKKVTKKGMACVLSPAAASYGYFKNFEERGEKFCELVKSL